jgi:DNA-binding transcriptional ArsR family regulator
MTAPKEITGNALRVYLYLVTHDPSELREIQRGLGLSTPSLASYHLSRLVEAGYATRARARVGTTLVHRLLFFSFLFTILITFFSYQALYSNGFTIYLVATSIANVALL